MSKRTRAQEARKQQPDARMLEMQRDWDNEQKRERWNTAGELAAERKPLPELAVVDDPALRHDAAVAAQNANDAATRTEKAVARGFNLTEAAGVRAIPTPELTAEEKAAARRMGESLLADPKWENLHVEIRRVLAQLGE